MSWCMSVSSTDSKNNIVISRGKELLYNTIHRFCYSQSVLRASPPVLTHKLASKLLASLGFVFKGFPAWQCHNYELVLRAGTTTRSLRAGSCGIVVHCAGWIAGVHSSLDVYYLVFAYLHPSNINIIIDVLLWNYCWIIKNSIIHFLICTVSMIRLGTWQPFSNTHWYSIMLFNIVLLLSKSNLMDLIH